MNRRTLLKLPLAGAAAPALLERALAAAEAARRPTPDLPGVYRFCVIGDSGSGSSGQMRVANRMREWHKNTGWSHVLATGDNIYENGEPKHFESKYIDVYRPLFDAGVKFHCTLGNHDVRHRDGRDMVAEEAFGFVDRQEEYEFAAGPKTPDGKQLARFICLNSTRWVRAIESGSSAEVGRLADALRERLRRSDSYAWNMLYLHHPMHSQVKRHFFGLGKGHGSNAALQRVLEPELRETIDVVFAGHDHFFQHAHPVNGVHHFVAGGAGKVRKGSNSTHENVIFGADAYHFLDLSLSETTLSFQAIDDDGEAIHSGAIEKKV